MKISAVIENTSQCGLQTEHGLSLWIEACGRKFYFDLGQGDMFVDNSKEMGVDPSEAEFAIISHGHYDHGGGIGTFLSVNQTAPVYISQHAFIDCYSHKDGRVSYIGLHKSVKPGGRVVPVDGVTHLSEGLILIDQCQGTEFFSPANKRILKRHVRGKEQTTGELDEGSMVEVHSTKNSDTDSICSSNTLFDPSINPSIILLDDHNSEQISLIEDDFLHEQSLIIIEGDKRVLIGGCAHSGIINIMNKAERVIGAPLTDVITGLHLKGVEDMEFIDSLADALLKRDCKYYTCHCTGEDAYQRLKDRMGDRIDYFSCGQTLTL